MRTLGYYNGVIDEIENMTIPMNDRVCYFGDGIYDATYSRNHIIYTLDEHMDRFYNSAALLNMDVGMSKNALKTLLCELVEKVDDGEQFVYWQLTRGTGTRSHVPDKTQNSNLWVVLRPVKVKNTYEKTKLITVDDTRFYHCNIKTLNLIVNVMASQKAEEAGCHEVVFHRGDRVTECAHSNVHIIKDGTFITPPTDNLILPGIARMNLLKFCAKLGIPTKERPFTLEELMGADEVIISSAGSFCISAEEIDGVPVGGKAPQLLKSLQDALVLDYTQKTAVLETNRTQI